MVSAPLTTARVREIAGGVPDPELPMISIDDLGILRDVSVDGRGHVVVHITPTYSGCPAVGAIRSDVLSALGEYGIDDAEVRLVLAPAWTTDWITPAGRDALRRHGIAPPGRARMVALTLRCPRCGSPDTRELARFGSTACKALWVCAACREPFEHMKAL